mgnify:CR=1 FL=1
MKYKLYIILLLSFLLGACRDKFLPAINDRDTDAVLIVEGNITPGSTSNITLSFSKSVNEALGDPYIKNASVQIENDNGLLIATLLPNGLGLYSLNYTPIHEKYFLRIKTAQNEEFLSESIVPLVTPLIDSISWRQYPVGVRVFVSTKDPNSNVQFYKWSFEETWEYKSSYFTNIEYDVATNRVKPRDLINNEVYTCWRSTLSNTINIGSSVRHSDNTIHENELVFIPNGDVKLSVRYSILVKQIALSKEAYSFYELLKKNTEDIGSLFSGQPSEVHSNIKCITNPNKKVVGFVLGGNINTKRIFISKPELDRWSYSQMCGTFEVPNMPDSLKFYFGEHGYMPYEDLGNSFNAALGTCVDCRLMGGTNIKPAFW